MRSDQNGHITLLSSLEAAKTLGPQTRLTAFADDATLSFGDPQLAVLLAKAVSDSPHYQQALARVHRAESYVGVERSRSLPSIAADGSVSESRLSENSGYPAIFVPKGLHSNTRLTLGAMWDVDLFGRNRAALAAATSEAHAAQYDLDEARLALRVSVARAYVDFADAIATEEQATSMAALQDRMLTLIGMRVRAGLDDQTKLRLADASAQSAHQQLVAARSAVKIAQFEIAALVGAGPDYGLRLTTPDLKDGDDARFEQLGADAIASRPDVAASKLRIEAAAARVKVAQRSFYPNISLSALAGFQSIDVEQALLGSSAIPNFGAAIHLPLFEGGRLRSEYRAQQADYDGAVASYNEAVINGLQDVSIAMVKVGEARQRYTSVARVYDDLQFNAQLAEGRHRANLTSQIPLIDAKASALAAKGAEVDARLNVIKNKIDMIRALGGRIIVSASGGESENVGQHDGN